MRYALPILCWLVVGALFGQELSQADLKELQRQKLQFENDVLPIKTTPITLAGELDIVRRDLLDVPAPERRYVRYLTAGFMPLTATSAGFVDFINDENKRPVGLVPDAKNPFVAKATERKLNSWELTNRVAFFGLNSLSTSPAITEPQFVPGTNGRIIRFQLHHYKIRSETWEWFAAKDPYFRHLADAEIYKQTGSWKPLLRTEWFLSKAFTEPNYSALLFSANPAGVPKTDKDVYAFFKFRVEDAAAAEREFQAAVGAEESYVALRARRLRRYDGILDYLHISDDFFSNADLVRVDPKTKRTQYVQKDPIENLLDPKTAKQFYKADEVVYEPDGHEGIWALQNGLQGYYISDAKGNLVAKANPDLGVRDTMNSFDPQVYTGKSCIWCHRRGMNPPVNLPAVHFNQTVDLRSYDPEVLETLRRVYDTAYGRKIKDDSANYCFAVGLASGLDATANANAFREIVQAYDYRFVTREQAALECGVDVPTLEKAVAASTSFRLMALFGKERPTPIGREVWENLFQSVMVLLGHTNPAPAGPIAPPAAAIPPKQGLRK